MITHNAGGLVGTGRHFALVNILLTVHASVTRRTGTAVLVRTFITAHPFILTGKEVSTGIQIYGGKEVSTGIQIYGGKEMEVSQWKLWGSPVSQYPPVYSGRQSHPPEITQVPPTVLQFGWHWNWSQFVPFQ